MFDIQSIDIKNPSPTLFSSIAEQAADACVIPPSKQGEPKNKDADKNRPAQLRQLYDELVMWQEKISRADDREAKFREVLPFIQMMRAKVAYSYGREKVTKLFREMFDKVISDINSYATLENAKLFMEAFMGYLKYYKFVRNPEKNNR